MRAETPTLQEIISDGRWLAHRYDETQDAVQFRFVPREVQRSVTFLTDFEIGEAPLVVFSRTDCLGEVRKRSHPTAPMIFHSAYCCSTLLARAFDIPGVAFGLKEPQILNDVVGLQLRRGDPRQVAAALDIALLLLARPLGAGEINVIKPSNLLNPLAPLITTMRPDLHGLFLHAPLETFLASIARKDIEGRAWVRDLMWKYISLGQMQRFGFSNEDLYRQTDLQAGAVSWLSQHGLFADIADQQHAFRTLDSETLIARPVECLSALGDLLNLSFDTEPVANGPAFRTHSKDRSAYSNKDRGREQDRGKSLHAREIEIVLKWAGQLAEHAGIPMILPSPLIGSSWTNMISTTSSH